MWVRLKPHHNPIVLLVSIKQRQRWCFQLDDNLGAQVWHLLASQEMEGHAMPSPVIHVQITSNVSRCLWLLIHPFFISVSLAPSNRSRLVQLYMRLIIGRVGLCRKDNSVKRKFRSHDILLRSKPLFKLTVAKTPITTQVFDGYCNRNLDQKIKSTRD